MKVIKCIATLCYLFFCFPIVLNAQIEKQYFQSFDNSKIAYQDIGVGDPVLLLHDFIYSGDDWNNTALKDSLISNGYRLIIPDLRGSGDSDQSEDPSKYMNNAEVLDISKLLDHLQLSNLTAIGYSRGSIILANLITRDKRITRAVLGGVGEHFTMRKWKKKKLLEDVFLNGVQASSINEPLVNLAHKTSANKSILGYLLRYQPVTSKTILKRLKIPTLIIAAIGDEENGDPSVLASIIPKANLIYIRGDHNTCYKVSSFARAVNNWLKRA